MIETTLQIALLVSESVHEIEKNLQFEILVWKGHD